MLLGFAKIGARFRHQRKFFEIGELDQNRARLNPLTIIIENARAAIIWGQSPNGSELVVAVAANLLIALLGYAWFQRTRKGFADVL